MLDFEKLGAFYLGKRVDEQTDSVTDELVLYDSRDLTTHAVIIGMTGSGKTGLGIGLLEEAALDHIPVIAIDPKGDLGNLMLTFPRLGPDDFLPWVNPRQATEQGRTVAEFAKDQAALWKRGLADWGQDGRRIANLRESADVAIYTPGSSAGLPVSVLRSFDAPPEALRADDDLYRERILATATGLLSLLGIDADPLTSREHILLSRILDEAWSRGGSLDLASLIAAVQDPPLDRVGVVDLETFYPEKDRFALAMRLNNLIAAPGFEAWTEGGPLDVHRLLYTGEGKPRISVMSIAHLDDAQRMFFVTMLLNELVAWMRAQQGTGSLRAILYVDEIFGYMPPSANPPSKRLLLTLLKQARAYGLGLVLATQNPVDLDYKGLSNAGTWFIGRLQTERDKARIMDGLEGSSAQAFDRQRMERRIAALGKRRFLLHNVHEDEPVVFATRWVMSYLAGPLTRDQIRQLMAGNRPAAMASTEPAPRDRPAAPTAAPVVPPGIRQYYLPARDGDIVYYPRLVAAAALTFSNARYGVNEERGLAYTVEVDPETADVDWDDAEKLDAALDDLAGTGEPSAAYAECPAPLLRDKNYGAWEREFKRWLRNNETITLYRSPRFRIVSNPGETEGEFRARLQQRVSEERDQAIAKLRQRYATKVTTLENRLMRAQQKIEREQEHASQRNLDTALSFGTAILGAVLGRKRLSTSTANRVGTAVRRAGAARRKAGDVERAREEEARVREELEALEQALAADIDALGSRHDAQAEEVTEIVVKPKTTDVHVPLIGILWMPYRDGGDGRLLPAWD